MVQQSSADRVPAVAAGAQTQRRWLLLIHQLPPQSSNLRVSIWRRLQQMGALPLKQSVYVLPDSPNSREDFEWLKTEVKAAGGDATVFAADHLDAWSDDALVDEFRRVRQESYDELAQDVEQALTRASSGRRPRGTRAPAWRRLTEIFRERLVALERIDFFGSAGRDRVLTLVRQLDERASGFRQPTTASPSDTVTPPAGFRERLWITRPRPGVDRMASAWLIRRFIDPQARFGFAADQQSVPQRGVPFDMFGVEFSHQGDDCTFETLCSVFALHEPALARVAAIVHDLDLKDGRFGAPECSTVAAMIEGLQLAHQDDEALLAQGMTLFDSLYRSFEQAGRSTGPRSMARPTQSRTVKRSAQRAKRRGRHAV
jgi:hypothetical protein